MSDEELVDALRRTLAADAAEVDAIPDLGDVVVRRQRRERRRLITLGVVVALALVGTGVLMNQLQTTKSRTVDVPSEPGPSRSSDVDGPAVLRRALGPASSFETTVGEPTATRVDLICTPAWVLDLDVVIAGNPAGGLVLTVPLARSDEFSVASTVIGSPPGSMVPDDPSPRAIAIAVSAPSGRTVTAEFGDGRVVTEAIDRGLAMFGTAQEAAVAAGGPDPLTVTRLTVRTAAGADVVLVPGGPSFNGFYGADGTWTGRDPSRSDVDCGGS